MNKIPLDCVMPAYNGIDVVGWMPALHDWRMAKRVTEGEVVYEFWYCTRCRITEERRVPRSEDAGS